jgi:hypothetical protein
VLGQLTSTSEFRGAGVLVQVLPPSVVPRICPPSDAKQVLVLGQLKPRTSAPVPEF